MKLREKRPSPADHNPDKLYLYYKNIKKLKTAFKIYDPNFVPDNSPGPLSYRPLHKKTRISPGFQQAKTYRLKKIEDFGVSPNSYDMQNREAYCSLTGRVKGGVIG